jgi:hypothetical protein
MSRYFSKFFKILEKAECLMYKNITEKVINIPQKT